MGGPALWVVGHPSCGDSGRLAGLATVQENPRKAIEHGPQPGPPPFALQGRPVVELRGVVEVEALEELAPVGIRAVPEPLDAVAALLVVGGDDPGRVAGQLVRALQGAQVKVNVGPGAQAEEVPVDEQALGLRLVVRPQRTPEVGQGTPKRRTGLPVVALGPQQRRKLRAPVRPAFGGEIGQEGERLPGAQDQRRAAPACGNRPQELQLQRVTPHGLPHRASETAQP